MAMHPLPRGTKERESYEMNQVPNQLGQLSLPIIFYYTDVFLYTYEAL